MITPLNWIRDLFVGVVKTVSPLALVILLASVTLTLLLLWFRRGDAL